MAIEFRDLRWAIIAAHHRSLRQAAETLNVRQSTLSRAIRDLEGRLGATLFERSNGGTRPTLEGQEFLEAARRIVEETEALALKIKTRARGESGRLTLGIQCSFSAGNLRATLTDYRRRYPNIDLRLADGSSDHLISDLARSTIDIAFIAEDDSRWDDKTLPVWSERIVVAIPELHLLSRQNVIHWHDLQHEAIFMSQCGPGRQLAELLARKIGHRNACRLLHQNAGLDRLLTMVGSGWGLLLALEGATGAVYPGVVFREVHDAEGVTRLNFRALWRQANGNPSLRPFLSILVDRYPDLTSSLEL